MAELPLPEKGQQISEHSDPPKASPGLPEPPPPAAPENAAGRAWRWIWASDDPPVARLAWRSMLVLIVVGIPVTLAMVRYA